MYPLLPNNSRKAASDLLGLFCVTSIELTQNIFQTLISLCRASCYNGEAARFWGATAVLGVSPMSDCRGNPPPGDASGTPRANASRLRRETRLQRWTHRNALATLCLCGSLFCNSCVSAIHIENLCKRSS
jgi:hypothetical protein